MILHKTRKSLTKERSNLPLGIKVGFVPTMGNLHEGHLSLVRESMASNDTTIISIFVNPKQFGENEDLHKYPRTLDDDIKKLKELQQENIEHKIIVFAPNSEEEIFPPRYETEITTSFLSSQLEGKERPGHFAGVTTVLYTLFKLIRPDYAYFGKKDYQQFIIVKKMVKDLLLPLKVIGCPTVRSESGLALSSRNQYLTESEKEKALNLSQTIKEIATLIENMVAADQKINIKSLNTTVEEKIKGEQWSYLEVRELNTLDPINEYSLNVVILGALKVGTTRLLDNLEVFLKRD